MLQFPIRSPMLPAQRQVLRTFENAFVVFALLLMTGSLRFLYSGLGGGGEIDLGAAQDGNRSFQLLMLSCYGIAGIVLLLNFAAGRLDLALNGQWAAVACSLVRGGSGVDPPASWPRVRTLTIPPRSGALGAGTHCPSRSIWCCATSKQQACPASFVANG